VSELGQKTNETKSYIRQAPVAINNGPYLLVRSDFEVYGCCRWSRFIL